MSLMFAIFYLLFSICNLQLTVRHVSVPVLAMQLAK